MRIRSTLATAGPMSAVLYVLLATSACTTDRVAKGPLTVSPAVGAYLLDDITGGRRLRTEKVVGAGIGGIAAADIGGYMDRQERELRDRTIGSDVRVTRQGDDLILNIPASVNFAYKSDTLTTPFQHTLDMVATVLGTYDRSFVDVYGHTDATGPDGYNQGLSERRARSVGAYLVSRGVKSARIGTRGLGKMQAIASNETADGQAANRRVEIKIVPIAESDVR